MLGWLRSLFASRPPTAFEVLAQRVSAARLEAAKLHAYAVVGAQRLEDLEASERLWRGRAELATAKGRHGLAEAARAAADEDAGRVAVGRRQLTGMRRDAMAARELVDGMLVELERVSLTALGAGARLPTVIIDDAAAARQAAQEAREAAELDGLEDATEERDFLARAFETLELSPELH